MIAGTRVPVSFYKVVDTAFHYPSAILLRLIFNLGIGAPNEDAVGLTYLH